MALAMEWVAKITTVGVMMVLPAVGGKWLDARWGTSYWTGAGLVIGMVAGFVYLLQITRRPPDPPLAAEELLHKHRQDSSGERTGK
jgi:putative F0F1-ATPase subunit (Ca2+/Mg2+ transporter)